MKLALGTSTVLLDGLDMQFEREINGIITARPVSAVSRRALVGTKHHTPFETRFGFDLNGGR